MGIACTLLVLATALAYCNSLCCPFVFDDKKDIIDNPSIRSLWPVWRVFLAEQAGSTCLQGRPVVNLSLAINYATGGLETLHYHLTNLAVHLLAGLTLFGIVRRTLCLSRLQGRYAAVATPLAFVVAATWMLHPLATQAVTFVSQRYESMMGMFYLVSLYCVIRSDSSTSPGCSSTSPGCSSTSPGCSSPHSRWWAAGAVAACLFALGPAAAAGRDSAWPPLPSSTREPSSA